MTNLPAARKFQKQSVLFLHQTAVATIVEPNCVGFTSKFMEMNQTTKFFMLLAKP